MVRRTVWTTLLAYNLMRSTAAADAVLHKMRPREISFTSTVQFTIYGHRAADRFTQAYLR